MIKVSFIATLLVIMSCKSKNSAIIGEWSKTEDTEVIKFTQDSAIITYPYSDTEMERMSLSYVMNNDTLTFNTGTSIIQLVIIKQSSSKLTFKNLKDNEVAVYERLK
jgi:hypothetical protein